MRGGRVERELTSNTAYAAPLDCRGCRVEALEFDCADGRPSPSIVGDRKEREEVRVDYLSFQPFTRQTQEGLFSISVILNRYEKAV